MPRKDGYLQGTGSVTPATGGWLVERCRPSFVQTTVEPLEENGGCRLAIERWVNHEAVPQAAANRPKRVAPVERRLQLQQAPRQFSWPMIFTELAWMMLPARPV